MEIITYNSTYENGIMVGGYHEIHNINFLQNENHAIATIISVITNNLLYGCDDTTLEGVSVKFDSRNNKIKVGVMEYFAEHSVLVNVYFES